MKVLVVDDTKNIRILLATCLEIEGYQVISATNGQEALDLLFNEGFDLVFLDIKLPEISGTEVLRKVREGGISTPIVIMTAFATVKNAVECTKLGAIAYLQKPFTLEKVRQVLDGIRDALKEQDLVFEDYLNKSRKLLAEGDFNQAYTNLKQALAMEPARKEVYNLLAEAYRGLGNYQEAVRFESIAAQFQD